MIAKNKPFNQFLEHIVIIGGGRWARVLIKEICWLVSTSTKISIYSPNNATYMLEWIHGENFEQHIQVLTELPQLATTKLNVVIVVNAARDHYRAIKWGISNEAAVLTEKPITLNFAKTQELINLANKLNIKLASAHIFLFASYLKFFANYVNQIGKIHSIKIVWADSKVEIRYGEQKQYDPGLPIIADLLPHITSIIWTITSNLPEQCEKLRIFKGGAQVELGLKVKDIQCDVQLSRNSIERKRIIEIIVDKKEVRLDFSTEQIVIYDEGKEIIIDNILHAELKPSVLMLKAFFQWVVDGNFDKRLDINIGMCSNRLIDQALIMYKEILKPWLLQKLCSSMKIDEDLYYALNEFFQFNDFLSKIVVEQQITKVRQWMLENSLNINLDEINLKLDPFMILKSITQGLKQNNECS